MFTEAIIARRFNEAAEIARKKLRQLEKTSGTLTREFCLALLDVAIADRAQRKFADAAARLEQAVTTLKHMAPSSEQIRRDLTRCLGSLGEVYLHLNMDRDAEAVLLEAIALIPSMPLRPDIDTWIESLAFLRMADLCAKRQNWDGASQRLIESLRHSRPSRSGDRGLYCDGLAKLSQIYARQGRLVGAEKLIRRAILLHRDYHSRDSLDYVRFISILGRLLLKRGDHQAAESLREEALQIVRKLRPEDDLFVNRVESYFRIEPGSTP